MKAAIIGGGVIGGGWVARFLLNGWDVHIFDPADEAERKIGEVLNNARRSLPMLYDKALPEEGSLTFFDSLEGAIEGADWIQESVPERLDVKHKVHAQIHAANKDAVIASSTSGFKPSEINEHGGNTIVAHPFNPVYLLPLVELVGDFAEVEKASKMLKQIGMYPLHVRQEIDAHIADRLLEAVWREALWLVSDGIATTEEIDEAIRMGFGLRWAQMGLFETYRIAGGEAGMEHFMAQFGPALAWPWTKLMDVPEFNDDLVKLIASQSDAQSGHHKIRELERIRDENLIGIMRALKHSKSAAGTVILEHEKSLVRAQDDDLPISVERTIPTSWTDHNGHMNESHYLELGSRASDSYLAVLGFDMQYIEAGHGFFTADNHITYKEELLAGDAVIARTQILNYTGKIVHLFHRIINSKSNKVVSTVETLLVHVDLNTRAATPIAENVAAAINEAWQQHKKYDIPADAGRSIMLKRS